MLIWCNEKKKKKNKLSFTQTPTHLNHKIHNHNQTIRSKSDLSDGPIQKICEWMNALADAKQNATEDDVDMAEIIL